MLYSRILDSNTYITTEFSICVVCLTGINVHKYTNTSRVISLLHNQSVTDGSVMFIGIYLSKIKNGN